MPGKLPNIVAAIPPADSIVESSSKVASSSDGLPPFISMPQSSAQLTDRISNSPSVLEDSDNEVSKDDFNQVDKIFLACDKIFHSEFHRIWCLASVAGRRGCFVGQRDDLAFASVGWIHASATANWQKAASGIVVAVVGAHSRNGDVVESSGRGQQHHSGSSGSRHSSQAAATFTEAARADQHHEYHDDHNPVSA